MRTIRLWLCMLSACGDLAMVEDDTPAPSDEGTGVAEVRLRCPPGTHKVGRTCAPDVVCGDGTCLGDEDCASCAADCGACEETNPTDTPAGCPATGYLRLVNVSTMAQLITALGNAQPGDQIRLASGTYSMSGAPAISRSGTATNRITLCGPRTAIFNGNNAAGTWLDVKGSNLLVKGFRITAAAKGVFQEAGSNNIYDDLELDHLRTEGIILHTTSTNNVIRYSYIHDTGLEQPGYGEGIYVGRGSTNDQAVNYTHIHHNRLENISAEGIEIKVPSSWNLIEFNTLKNAGSSGLVGATTPLQVRGSNNRVFDNTIDGNKSLAIGNGTGSGDLSWANYNTYRRNKALNIVSGTMFRFESGHVGNVVYCDNVPVSPVVMGVTCTP
jgi:hypothetical protein